MNYDKMQQLIHSYVEEGDNELIQDEAIPLILVDIAKSLSQIAFALGNIDTNLKR